MFLKEFSILIAVLIFLIAVLIFKGFSDLTAVLK